MENQTQKEARINVFISFMNKDLLEYSEINFELRKLKDRLSINSEKDCLGSEPQKTPETIFEKLDDLKRTLESRNAEYRNLLNEITDFI